MLPRFNKYVFPGGSIFQCRWGVFGYDILISKQGFKLLQYGKKGSTLRFICRVSKKAGRAPLFLLSPQWKSYYRSKTIAVGETTKPFSMTRR